MRLIRKLIYPLLLIICGFAIYNQAWAISIRELLGMENEEQESTQTADSENNKASGGGQDWARQDAAATPLTLDLADIQRLMVNLNETQKKPFLEDAEKFKQFVLQEANNMSLLSAARANKMESDENTLFLMQRSAENVLREIYLSKLVVTKLPADFPTDQQIREYFDKNQASFFLGERVHVWQIFLKIDAGMNEGQVAAIKKRIQSMREDILNKKLDFADAAMQFSDHPASKAMGGYMGLVKVSDLKPELTKPLMNLPEGELSDLITSDTGVHLLKRGAIVPKQDVTFEQVQSQIRDLLLQQARAQLRQAIYDQASKTYPVELQDTTLEEWRQQLLK
ncbi:MAG: putative peptidyl-prolyl cis-trans isomerase, PpiC-type [Gammaproteobacteria bacterium]|nr:putative peptidyl-prolyl cis-trans isomerase, PpiC-type [Gammaproteobacteria bacterium]